MHISLYTCISLSQARCIGVTFPWQASLYTCISLYKHLYTCSIDMYQTFVKHLSNVYKTLIKHLANTYTHVSNLQNTFIQHVVHTFMKRVSHISQTCMKQFGDSYQTHVDLWSCIPLCTYMKQLLDSIALSQCHSIVRQHFCIAVLPQVYLLCIKHGTQCQATWRTFQYLHY